MLHAISKVTRSRVFSRNIRKHFGLKTTQVSESHGQNENEKLCNPDPLFVRVKSEQSSDVTLAKQRHQIAKEGPCAFLQKKRANHPATYIRAGVFASAAHFFRNGAFIPKG